MTLALSILLWGAIALVAWFALASLTAWAWSRMLGPRDDELDFYPLTFRHLTSAGNLPEASLTGGSQPEPRHLLDDGSGCLSDASQPIPGRDGRLFLASSHAGEDGAQVEHGQCQ